MTEIKAKVVEFDLFPHFNADALSVAKIRNTGWQCIVKTSDMVGRTLGVYIPIDALVNVTNEAFKFLDKGECKPFRIKTIKLRGLLSQGLLIPAPEGAKLGDDLTEELEVTRWEPVIPALLAGDIVREPDNFQKYTSIENYKNFPNVFQEGDLVRVTEKLHGSNARMGFINEGFQDGHLTYYVGSHKTSRDKEGSNLYSKLSRLNKIEEKLLPILQKYKPSINFILMLEIIGSGVQDLTYGCDKNEQQFRLFDILIDHVYQPWEVIEDVALALKIGVVPLLYRGPYILDKIVALRDGSTTLEGSHCREGVVVTAEPENYSAEVGRKILKFISDDYLLRKNARDGH